MQEKKPTIDEIIKGLDNLSCYHDEKGVHEFLRGVIALIQDQRKKIGFLEKDYRELHEEKCKLQKENAEYERKLADGDLVSIEWHDEQVGHANKEIERLTEERDKQRKLYVKEFAEHANHLGEFEGIKRQAVKDTAKEILQYVGDLYDDGDQRFRLKDYQWHKNLCERYGVEVE